MSIPPRTWVPHTVFRTLWAFAIDPGKDSRIWGKMCRGLNGTTATQWRQVRLG